MGYSIASSGEGAVVGRESRIPPTEIRRDSEPIEAVQRALTSYATDTYPRCRTAHHAEVMALAVRERQIVVPNLNRRVALFWSSIRIGVTFVSRSRESPLPRSSSGNDLNAWRWSLEHPCLGQPLPSLFAGVSRASVRTGGRARTAAIPLVMNNDFLMDIFPPASSCAEMRRGWGRRNGCSRRAASPHAPVIIDQNAGEAKAASALLGAMPPRRLSASAPLAHTMRVPTSPFAPISPRIRLQHARDVSGRGDASGLHIYPQGHRHPSRRVARRLLAGLARCTGQVLPRFSRSTEAGEPR